MDGVDEDGDGRISPQPESLTNENGGM